MHKNADHKYSAPCARNFRKHPYGSTVEWRIAVSRKHNDPVINAIYEKQIQPIIASHGIALECSFASDEPADIEFWANRMRKMFGCADLHILIDIHRSGNMNFEFRVSNSCARSMGRNSVTNNSGFAEVCRLPWTSCLSMQIRVIDGEGKTTFNRCRRRAVVRALPHDLLGDRIHEALQWAKKRRAFELKMARIFYDLPAMFSNKKIKMLEMPTVMAIQEQMTAVAAKLAAGKPMIEAHGEYFSEIKEVLPQVMELLDMSQGADGHSSNFGEEEHIDPRSKFANLMDRFEIDILTGSKPLPKRFREAYSFIQGETAPIWMEYLGTGKWIRRLHCVSSALLILRFKRALRRSQPPPAKPEA